MKYVVLFAMALVSGSAQPAPNALNEQALQLSAARQFDAAEKLFRESISGWHAMGAAYDLHASIVEVNLAQMYAARGERQRCATTMEEALAVHRRTLGVKDLRTLTVINLLAGNYLMLGNHDRASQLFEEALPVERRLYPQDVQMARTLSGLASLALQEDRVQDGAPLAEEALTLSIQSSGEESIDTALAYANLAEAYRVQGKPERAAPLFRKSRAAYEKRLGPDHPRVASVLTQEALMAFQEGKLGTAEEMLNRSLAILAKSCPDCAYERIAAQNDLALVRIRQGKFEEADRLLSAVLTSQEHADSLPAAEIAVTLNSLAVVRQKEKMFEDAERLRRRAAVLTMTYR